MALKIDTFSNQVGGFSFFKAVGHPLTAEALDGLLDRLAGLGPAALYDPMGHLGTLAELHDLSRLTVAGVFVQARSEEHTSELQSLMRISYAVFRLKKKK